MLLLIALVWFLLKKTNLKNVIVDRVSRFFRQEDRPDSRHHRADPSAPPSEQRFKTNNEFQSEISYNCSNTCLKPNFVGSVTERVELCGMFTATMFPWSWFNSHPRRSVALLDKTLYISYDCVIVSNKQQINGKKSWKKSKTGILRKIDNCVKRMQIPHIDSVTSLSHDWE